VRATRWQEKQDKVVNKEPVQVGGQFIEQGKDVFVSFQLESVRRMA
jgi:hypothetical protein